jgi:hypothetical protein
MTNAMALQPDLPRIDNQSDMVLYWTSHQSAMAMLNAFLSVSTWSAGAPSPVRYLTRRGKVNTTDLLQFSLGAAFDILGEVTGDLTQEQADWRPPGKANTIGSIYSHILTYVDYYVRNYLIEAKPQPVTVESRSAELWMQDVQVNLSELHAYAGQVRSTAQDWLSTVNPKDLERRELTTAGEINMAQALELFVIWHINAHCGEISALKGCQGLKGYPW